MESATHLFIALFALCNPAGIFAIFLSLTSGLSPTEQRKIALAASFYSFLTLLASVWIGKYIMEMFEIDVSSLEIAGGLILLLIGLKMILDNEHKKLTDKEKATASSDEGMSIAFVPLTLPMTVGPAAISTVIIAVKRAPGIEHLIEFSIVVGLFSIIIALTFCFAPVLQRYITPTIAGAIVRIMGLLLSAVAIGMIITGLKFAFPLLA